MKLGMKHERFKPIIFCSNDNPVLILTLFTAYAYTRLRYQVSVYMIIGPLVTCYGKSISSLR